MTALRQLRLVALLEGTSFLGLLFIAMPLKYLAGLPLAVRIVGSVHGVLFLMFMAVLYRAGSERGWPLRRWLIAFVSSVVPFGTFMFDRSLRREIAEVTPSPDGRGTRSPVGTRSGDGYRAVEVSRVPREPRDDRQDFS